MTRNHSCMGTEVKRDARASISRRALCRNAARLAGVGLPAGAARSWPAIRAQGLTGKISVGFDGSNAALAAVVEGAAATVQAANPGVEIDVNPGPSGNYETQLFLALSVGRAPDVFLVSGLGVGELGAADLLEPLDRYLGEWEGWTHYPDVVRQALTYNGSTWALPTSIDTHFLYYRKDLLASAGLPAEWQPVTPDDILAAARRVKAALPDVIPYGLYAGANGGTSTAVRGFLPLLYAYGGSMKDDSGRWIIDSPALRSALGYYQTVFQVDETTPQQSMTAANPAEMMRTAFASGELAMIYDGSWVYADWEAAAPEIAHEQTGYTLFPTADARAPFAIGGLGISWYINARSNAKDLAWALVAAGNTPEALVALNSVSPHIPPRLDAAADPAFQASPFLSAVVESIAVLQLAPADPAYRQLLGIIQNATGIVATGEATPDEAILRYAEEMTRILGEDRVTRQM